MSPLRVRCTPDQDSAIFDQSGPINPSASRFGATKHRSTQSWCESISKTSLEGLRLTSQFLPTPIGDAAITPLTAIGVQALPIPGISEEVQSLAGGLPGASPDIEAVGGPCLPISVQICVRDCHGCSHQELAGLSRISLASSNSARVGASSAAGGRSRWASPETLRAASLTSLRRSPSVSSLTARWLTTPRMLRFCSSFLPIGEAARSNGLSIIQSGAQSEIANRQ